MTLTVTYHGCTVRISDRTLVYFEQTGADLGAWIVSFTAKRACA